MVALVKSSIAAALVISFWWRATLASDVFEGTRGVEEQRRLQNTTVTARTKYYYALTPADLGGPDPDVAIGNPLKGLVESPLYNAPPYNAGIPLALEFYYIGMSERVACRRKIMRNVTESPTNLTPSSYLSSNQGLDKIMLGNPDVVGEEKAFNWTILDEYLRGSAARKMHAVWRVVLDYPYATPELMVPQYLLDAGIRLYYYDGGVSPHYGDPVLVEALGQFIIRFGKRYNGDKRLGFVQAGLLGFWGEWHTVPYDLIPEETKGKVVDWYSSSFNMTRIQTRYPYAPAYEAGFGLHDDSFAFETLDGEANGGMNRSYYFWPRVVKAGQGDFWKKGAMGGETRDVQQTVFEPSYPARTFQKQDFVECMNITHATYMFHHAAFLDGGFKGAELVNARSAHARMGYNFYVPDISAKASSLVGKVDINVTVTQIGVAPFYYELNLGIQCPGISKKTKGGVDKLIDAGASKVFDFTGIPATKACLDALNLSLETPYSYSGRPIKFAQRNGIILFSLPIPKVEPPSPTIFGPLFPSAAIAPAAPTPSYPLLPTKPSMSPSAGPSKAPPVVAFVPSPKGVVPAPVGKIPPTSKPPPSSPYVAPLFKTFSWLVAPAPGGR